MLNDIYFQTTCNTQYILALKTEADKKPFIPVAKKYTSSNAQTLFFRPVDIDSGVNMTSILHLFSEKKKSGQSFELGIVLLWYKRTFFSKFGITSVIC